VLVSITYVVVIIACVGEYNICVGDYNMCWCYNISVGE
jgi:hypothetical protein